jgi:3-hydroxyisobutyrate dehydrogenase-like beta-hydroxyacid dehydrogenase
MPHAETAAEAAEDLRFPLLPLLLFLREICSYGIRGSLAAARPSGAHRAALIASLIEALGEAFALARKTQMGAEALREVLAGTLLAGSPIFAGYAAQVAEERYELAGFKLRLGLKDVRLLLAAADDAGAPMPLASVLRDRLLSGVARGRGDLDWAALAAIAAEDAGLG